MSRPFITVGDKTSHGGTVITGDQSFLLHGKAVARVGDMTVCPQCKGTFPIATGAGDMLSLGQAPARDGDKTACGAILIAGQAVGTHSEGSSSGRDAAAISAANDAASAVSLTDAAKESGICLSCMVAAAKSGASMIVRT